MICLDATVPIPVLDPLRNVNEALLVLLRGFKTEDWRKPTVHPDRSVKDLTAHLLQGSLPRRDHGLKAGYPTGRKTTSTGSPTMTVPGSTTRM